MKTVNKPAGQQAAASNKPQSNGTDEFLAHMNQPVEIPNDMSGVSDEDAFAILESANNAQLTEMTSAYWKPTGAGTWVFKFLGMTTVTFDNEVQEAVELEDKNGMRYVAAQAVLVNSLKKVTELPTFCKVVCDGRKVKSSNGEYYNLQVFVFPSASK